MEKGIFSFGPTIQRLTAETPKTTTPTPTTPTTTIWNERTQWLPTFH